MCWFLCWGQLGSVYPTHILYPATKTLIKCDSIIHSYVITFIDVHLITIDMYSLLLTFAVQIHYVSSHTVFQCSANRHPFTGAIVNETVIELSTGYWVLLIVSEHGGPVIHLFSFLLMGSSTISQPQACWASKLVMLANLSVTVCYSHLAGKCHILKQLDWCEKWLCHHTLSDI